MTLYEIIIDGLMYVAADSQDEAELIADRSLKSDLDACGVGIIIKANPKNCDPGWKDALPFSNSEDDEKTVGEYCSDN